MKIILKYTINKPDTDTTLYFYVIMTLQIGIDLSVRIVRDYNTVAFY